MFAQRIGNVVKDIEIGEQRAGLEAVGLRGAAKLMPSELSGGMARRAALARAIALEPDLIMFDEPFVGQDPITMGVRPNVAVVLIPR